MNALSRITHITQPCIMCGETSQVEVEVADLLRWRQGALVQDVWPHWTDGQRELLISGTHDACFDALFAEPDEPTDPPVTPAWVRRLSDNARDLTPAPRTGGYTS